MLGLYERAAELARLVAREKNDSSGLFRITIEHTPQFAGASLYLLAWLAKVASSLMEGILRSGGRKASDQRD